MESLHEAAFAPLSTELADRLAGGATAIAHTGEPTRDYGLDANGNLVFLGYDSIPD
jgi:hypothetical protein